MTEPIFRNVEKELKSFSGSIFCKVFSKSCTKSGHDSSPMSCPVRVRKTDSKQSNRTSANIKCEVIQSLTVLRLRYANIKNTKLISWLIIFLIIVYNVVGLSLALIKGLRTFGSEKQTRREMVSWKNPTKSARAAQVIKIGWFFLHRVSIPVTNSVYIVQSLSLYFLLHSW